MAIYVKSYTSPSAFHDHSLISEEFKPFEWMEAARSRISIMTMRHRDLDRRWP